jgi:acyl-CoA thioesterase-2
LTRSAARAETLAEILDLERLEADLFRGVNVVTARKAPALFGGQVAAQALMAAGSTVPDDRHPHSLHGYFLRPGLADHPVVFRVARDRDGRSFSARHVAAVQHGEVIFSMLASFHVGGDGGVLDAVGEAEVPGPEACEPVVTGLPLEVRHVTRHEVVDGRRLTSDCMWVRAAGPLPEVPLVHWCALAFASDLGTGFGRVADPGLGDPGPSLDHALWFHEPIAADAWVLLRLWPAKAVAGRGLYRGAMRDVDGRLGVVLAQEHLLRPSVVPGAEGG